MRTHDTDGVVVEAHADTVGDADEISRIDIHLTIDIGMNQTAVNIDCAITVTLQTDELIRDETIDDGEWCVCHLKCGIDQTFALIAVGTTEQSEFLIVAQQSCLNGVSVILFHHIHQFGADISDRRTFISKLLHRHIGSYREMTVMVLQDVIVAIQQTRHTG